MILSGWILPDLYEVKCSAKNGHIEVVKHYLDNLKLIDKTTYDKIVITFFDESSSKPRLGLDDFAVIYLGWIKINDSPMKVIFYSSNVEAEYTIERYLNLGYYPIELKTYNKQILVNIPSNKLI